MPGTVAGGRKAAAKNLAKNPNFYKEIGARGGRISSNGGFAAKTPCSCKDIQGDHHKAQCAGVRGGRNRGYKRRTVTVTEAA